MLINEILLISVIAVLFIFFLKKLMFGRKSTLPPGPPGLPIIGSLTELTPRIYLAYERFHKQYGPIFTLKMGFQKMVILCSYEAMKEALMSQTFTGRSRSTLLFMFARNQGIAFTEGENWKNQRRTATKILRDVGFGKSRSKDIIQMEMDDLKQYIDKKLGQPIDPKAMFPRSTSRVVHALALNEKPCYDDPKLEQFIQDIRSVFLSMLTHFLPMFIPFAFKIPFVYELCMRYTATGKVRSIHEYIGSKVKEHMKTFSSQDEPKDFIDAFLATQNEARKEPGYTDELFEHRVRLSVFELFVDGTDTIATAIVWTFFLLAIYPEIQEKVQQEINSKLDKNSPIYMDDKKKLDYTSAFLDEAMRFSCVAPFGIEHRAITDGKIGNFNIPKDTIILPHFYSVLRDSRHWERPDEFYINHFLADDGKSYRHREQLIPFSVGPRSCFGEGLATMELFLYTASLIRDYQVKLHGNYSKAEIQNFLVGNDGFTRTLSPHELVFSRRS